MTPEQIKAICHELADTFGHKRMADAAGVNASTWSGYCNYEMPDTTIPLHRMFLVQRKLGRRDFTAAIVEEDKAGAQEATDPRMTAAVALRALGDATLHVNHIMDDDSVTPAEKREAQELVQALSARVHDLADVVAALPTGRVSLRAVKA